MPASSPLSLGMMGMHGEAYCNEAIQESDLILAFGMRFDDRVTGLLSTYAPKAKKIHVEIDETEVNKNVAVDLALMGDLKTVLTNLIPMVDEYDHEHWMAQIDEWKEETRQRSIMSWPDDGKLYTAHAVRAIWNATNGNARVVTGVGQHQMWVAQYYSFEKPNRLITSGGAGTMGFGLPASLGAWFADKENDVWLVDGDGGFQMTQAELTTLAQEKANVKIALMNNSFLGMVRQWQEFFFDKRYAETPISGPDFVKLAEAHGIPAKRVTKPEEAFDAIQFAQETSGPVLIEFQVEMEEAVYPMVPAGAPLNQMLRRPIRKQVASS